LLLPAVARAAPNKFSVARCKSILVANDEAAKTLRAILAAIGATTCSDVKVDKTGRTQLVSLDLKGKGLTDLSPFRLFNVHDGTIDLSHNDVSNVEPLLTVGSPNRINLSHTKVTEAAVLAKLLGSLVLDGDQIDDPSKFKSAGYDSWFSMRGNRSTRGADYDTALETMYRYYALFTVASGADDRHPKFDLQGMRGVLSPRLTRYITFKDVPVEAVFEDAARFYKQKRDVYYQLFLSTFKVEKRNGQVVATYTVDYGWQDEDLKGVDAGDEKITRSKQVRALAEVVFDSTFHVVSYAEKTVPMNKLIVVRATWATKDLADALNFLVVEDPGPFPKVKIPKGARLEEAFESVARDPGGTITQEEGFLKVIFKGKVLWVRDSSWDDENVEGELYVRRESIPL
jgi:hypothetical protein